jgi:large subunit ribosomal protein L35
MRAPRKKGKPHKGLQKRIKVTRNGKVIRSTSGNRHLATTKNAKRKRRLRKRRILDNPAIARTFARAMRAFPKKSPADAEAKEAALDGAGKDVAGKDGAAKTGETATVAAVRKPSIRRKAGSNGGATNVARKANRLKTLLPAKPAAAAAAK